MLDGVRLTSPARTWLDLASVLALDDLVAAGDALVNEHGPEFPAVREATATIQELGEILDAHAGARNIRIARRRLA